ncbi:MAG: F0F1 ATP synthase subunit gamma [Alphaproteobacteria bacterium]|nr:F0F1 ATP synthase subunit gamma [Alphaproteobacteria bacterium]
MPSLKDLKNRIGSVKSTRKITSAMKMVAASKLRRAQEYAEAARPYATRMARMLSALCKNLEISDSTPRLLAGTGKDNVILLVVVTSDRGLCGAFNGSIVRETRRLVRVLEGEGKQVKLLCVGRKGRDLLRRDHASKIVASFEDIGRKRIGFADADRVTHKITELFEAGQFDVAQIVFNRFKSVISQIVTVNQIVPVQIDADDAANQNEPMAVYEFEPNEEQILAQLLPHNLAMQVYAALLESAAGEQGARMTAMDNATRNAGDMIDRLTLNYNRSRQAYITKELIEIISGAEAV